MNIWIIACSSLCYHPFLLLFDWDITVPNMFRGSFHKAGYCVLRTCPSVFEANGTPLQYSRLENPMGGGAWKAAAVHGVSEGRTWLSNFTFAFHFQALEKEMATPVLAWRIPGTAEPGVPPSMGSHRVGHDWRDLAAAAAAAALINLFAGRQWRQT